MSNQQFDTLIEKLDILIKLTAMTILKDKNKTEQIGILSSLDFRPKEIALIVGTTPKTVRSLKDRLRKKAQKRAAKAPKTKLEKEGEMLK